MKLQLNPSITPQAIPDGTPVGKAPEAVAAPADGVRSDGVRSDGVRSDGVRISSAIAALDWSARIDQVTAAVQNGSYQVSSAATSNAIVEDALSDY
jgi:hypothetical protein